MQQLLKVVTPLYLFLGLTGCMSLGGIPRYPSDWPPVRGWLNCQSIAGKYKDTSEPGWPSSEVASLSAVLLREKGAEIKATHVVIETPSLEILQVSVWNGQSLVKRAELKAPKDFDCSESGVYMPLGGNKIGTTYWKAQDGSLVSLFSAAWWDIVIIPVRSERGEWSRWKRLDADTR